MNDLEELEDDETAGIGHNSGEEEGGVSEFGKSARDQLREYVEQIERLNEAKDDIASDIRAVFTVAKAAGYDTKSLREVIRLRKQDAREREEQAHITATYMIALGMG